MPQISSHHWSLVSFNFYFMMFMFFLMIMFLNYNNSNNSIWKLFNFKFYSFWF